MDTVVVGDSATLDKTYIAVSGILIFDSDGLISFANEQAAVLLESSPLNSSPADLIGRTVPDLFQSAGSFLAEAFWCALLRKSGHNISVRLSGFSETQWLAEFSAGPVFTSLDDDLHARLRHAVDSGMEGLSLHNADGLFVYVNPAEAELYGYRVDELIGEHWSKLYCPDQVELINELYFPVVLAEGKWRGELKGQRKDQSRFDVEVSLTLIRDEADTPVGLICTCRDISERKLTEHQLRQAAAVFASAGQGIVITDVDFRIIAVNPATLDTSGYTEQQLLGQPIYFLSNKDRRNIRIADLFALAAQGKCWQGEIWAKRANGQIYPIWMTMSAVYTDNESLTSLVFVFSDISSTKEAQAKLDRLAHYDHLTGLPNRLLLNQELDTAILRAKRRQQKIALLFLDLDYFKNINDSLGHAVGDELLKEVARRIRECCHPDDMVARLSGDEFTVVCQNLPGIEQAEHLASRLISCISEPMEVAGHDYYQNVSIGIAMYPRDGSCISELMKSADIAMYQAKAEGRQSYRVYDHDMAKQANEILIVERELREALVAEQFVLHYQPVLCAEGNLKGLEALVRWQHPERGLVFPDHFIHIAESSRIIISLGEWVLREACAQARRWLDAGLVFEYVAVNVSGGQLEWDFYQLVERVLAETGLPASFLELEITETYLMTDLQRPERVLQSLRSLGVHLAIDDFGIGYSSLARLKQLPINRLKIDRSFIRDIVQDDGDLSIVNAIIAMSNTLGLNVTAEGVETEAHYKLLKQHSRVCSQGYYFSRPVGVAAVEYWYEDKYGALI
ncbi:putative bifunctional diguanylate cyclase/phosphodiesterase [Aliamphritea hakodatensis]|uniref:putative bifunctional diguanylate cyclase/phosphodiesterase n=1 Tax=Aliamphritea hakodatensis TaxID=2895352 RepID=UPI0022FD868E|nr:EAL domain-containing protein [Aliamphritea hakodatensis]